MKTRVTSALKHSVVQLLTLGAMASLGNAAVINLTDFSLAPDGAASTGFQTTNVGNVLPTSTTVSTVIYFVTTFTFGAGSDAHLIAQFAANNSETVAGRLGVQVNDEGLVQLIGTNPVPSVNLNQDMSGQTITLLSKLHYDPNHSTIYARSNASDDTLMNVWVNPTMSSVEGSGLSAGEMSTVWNSAGFFWFRQVIQNQGTLETAGASTIGNTVILTGSDATFANALTIAVPEPTTALLGGLGLFALLRRRRG